MIGLNLGQHSDLKNGSYSYYVRYGTQIVRKGEMNWPYSGATFYHAQLELPDKGRAIKGLVV